MVQRKLLMLNNEGFVKLKLLCTEETLEIICISSFTGVGGNMSLLKLILNVILFQKLMDMCLL